MNRLFNSPPKALKHCHSVQTFLHGFACYSCGHSYLTIVATKLVTPSFMTGVTAPCKTQPCSMYLLMSLVISLSHLDTNNLTSTCLVAMAHVPLTTNQSGCPIVIVVSLHIALPFSLFCKKHVLSGMAPSAK